MVVPEADSRFAGLRIGVLALQGDFALHLDSMKRMGVEAVEVRRADQLDSLSGLILPGGESTAMLKLMVGTGMEQAIVAFHARGGGMFGTCAGMILLARGVHGPPQRSLGLLDIDIDRNGYGRQVDSFETDLSWPEDEKPLRGVFIRAPRVTRTGDGVTVLIERGGEALLVRQERVLAATFHPEATPDLRVHELFLEGLLESNPTSRCSVAGGAVGAGG